jgi:hypothetical protein
MYVGWLSPHTEGAKKQSDTDYGVRGTLWDMLVLP